MSTIVHSETTSPSRSFQLNPAVHSEWIGYSSEKTVTMSRAEKSADTIPVARFENEHYQIDICAALDSIPEWIDTDEDLPVIAP